MSCVRHVIKSIEDHNGSALNCWLATTLYVIASQEIFFANSLSSPFPNTDNNAIGLYDLGDVWSVLLGLGIIARIAVRNGAG